ncbi:MAG: hypothetical protein EOO11_05865 [Chitinophagaceae bacterium]|nr:MAG: hypothetical protein EOO11_05865 [Chitinophagaceae bacterium]
MRIVVALLLLLVATVSCSEDKSVPADTNRVFITEVCDRVVNALGREKFSESIQLIDENSVLDRADLDSLKMTMQEQFMALEPAYGRVIGSVFVREIAASGFVFKRVYLLRFQRQYLRCALTCYKGSGGWAITHFKYDNELFEGL